MHAPEAGGVESAQGKRGIFVDKHARQEGEGDASGNGACDCIQGSRDARRAGPRRKGSPRGRVPQLRRRPRGAQAPDSLHGVQQGHRFRGMPSRRIVREANT